MKLTLAKEDTMACRAQWSMLVRCGQYARILPQVEALLNHQVSRGLRDTRIWAPITGQSNRIIIETQFATMAELERELETTLNDRTQLNIREAIAAHTVEGTNERIILRSLDIPDLGNIIRGA
jgi:hypothetical protein